MLDDVLPLVLAGPQAVGLVAQEGNGGLNSNIEKPFVGFAAGGNYTVAVVALGQWSVAWKAVTAWGGGELGGAR